MSECLWVTCGLHVSECLWVTCGPYVSACLLACICRLLTFKYVSPLTSYRNWQSVLFRMAIVELLMWIRKAGNTNQTNERPPVLTSAVATLDST